MRLTLKNISLLNGREEEAGNMIRMTSGASAPVSPAASDQNRPVSILCIGPHEALDGLIAGFRDRRSVEPYLYTPYTPPQQALLERAAIVWVYDVEIPARFQQLAFCCAYQRRTCANLQAFAVSRRFADLQRRENSELAKRALNIGARILPQFSRV
jgi:hypothetical protein